MIATRLTDWGGPRKRRRIPSLWPAIRQLQTQVSPAWLNHASGSSLWQRENFVLPPFQRRGRGIKRKAGRGGLPANWAWTARRSGSMSRRGGAAKTRQTCRPARTVQPAPGRPQLIGNVHHATM